MGDIEKGKKIFVQKCAQCAILWKREGSTRLGQTSMVCLDERQVRLLDSLTQMPIKQRYHLGRGDADGVFGESQEVHPWNQDDLCWH